MFMLTKLTPNVPFCVFWTNRLESVATFPVWSATIFLDVDEKLVDVIYQIKRDNLLIQMLSVLSYTVS